MIIKDLMIEIESYGFGAKVNAASDFAGFMRAVREEKVVVELFELMGRKENLNMIFERLRELYLSQSDYRYENKWDVAIAVYLWLISIKDKRLGTLAGELVSGVQQCWWANKMSRSILGGIKTHNSGSVEVESSLGGVISVHSGMYFKQSEKTGESITLMGYLLDESLPVRIWDLGNKLFHVKGSCVGIHSGWMSDIENVSINISGKSGTLVGEEV